MHNCPDVTRTKCPANVSGETRIDKRLFVGACEEGWLFGKLHDDILSSVAVEGMMESIEFFSTQMGAPVPDLAVHGLNGAGAARINSSMAVVC